MGLEPDVSTCGCRTNICEANKTLPRNAPTHVTVDLTHQTMFGSYRRKALLDFGDFPAQHVFGPHITEHHATIVAHTRLVGQ